MDFNNTVLKELALPLASTCTLCASACSTSEAVRVEEVGGRSFFFPLCAGRKCHKHWTIVLLGCALGDVGIASNARGHMRVNTFGMARQIFVYWEI